MPASNVDESNPIADRHTLPMLKKTLECVLIWFCFVFFFSVVWGVKYKVEVYIMINMCHKSQFA